MALTKEDLQAISDLMDSKIEPLKTEMHEGFDRLENLINVAAEDAAKTEKAVREHLQQPHIA